MPIENEYCLVADGVVVDAMVASAQFAEAYAAERGFTAIQRPFMSVGCSNKYHDGKFWTGNTHEEEITE